MGAGYSSEEDDDEQQQQLQEEEQQSDDTKPAEAVLDKVASPPPPQPPLPTLHSSRSRMVQLSPAGRERGDGSEVESNEASTAAASSGPSVDNVRPRSKLIHLPETNIVLEKLPPIKDDSQEALLPQSTPTTPLVPYVRSFTED